MMRKILDTKNTLLQLSIMIKEYYDKYGIIPSLQSFKNKDEDKYYKAVMREYSFGKGGYTQYLQDYGLDELKKPIANIKLNELADILRNNMLLRDEVEKQYPEHFNILKRYYANVQGYYQKFLEDFNLADEYANRRIDAIRKSKKNIDEETIWERIFKILEAVNEQGKDINRLHNTDEYENLRYYCRRLGITPKQALNEYQMLKK